MNVLVPYKAGNLLTRWATTSFLKRPCSTELQQLCPQNMINTLDIHNSNENIPLFNIPYRSEHSRQLYLTGTMLLMKGAGSGKHWGCCCCILL